jgi:hypothetical protein
VSVIERVHGGHQRETEEPETYAAGCVNAEFLLIPGLRFLSGSAANFLRVGVPRSDRQQTGLV